MSSLEMHHQLGLGDQAPFELRGERDGVPRLEQQPQLAPAQRLLVLGQAGDDGHGAAGQRAQYQLRRGRGSGRRRDRDRGASEVLSLRAVGGPGQAHAAQPARQRHRRRRGRVAQPDRGAPVEAGRTSLQRARTAASRRAPPRPRRRSRGLLEGLGALQQVRPRQDERYFAWEVALHQVARGREAGGAPVESAEQQLDHLARHLRRDEALGGGVEGADVERARGRSAAEDALGANGSCTCTKPSRRGRAGPPACARHPGAATPSRRAGTAATVRRRAPTRSPPRRTGRRGSSAAPGRSPGPREPARASRTARPRPRGGRARRASSERRSTKRLTSWCCSQGLESPGRSRTAGAAPSAAYAQRAALAQ